MDALYFPYLNLPSSTWVNPALLFFDRLAVIAPDGFGRAEHDRRTDELMALDMVRHEVPRGEWGGADDEILVSYLIGRASNAHGRVDMARVHGGKMAFGKLASDLIGAKLLLRAEDGWLEGPGWVIAHLMSYLALQISANARSPLSLVTDERAAARVMVGSREASLESRRIRAATRLLPVPPDARFADIRAFRNQHSRELRSFRDYVNALSTRDLRGPDGEDRFEERLRQAKEVRAHLVNEMGSFDWRDRGLTICILALSTGAAQPDHAPWTLGAGLIGLGLTGMQTVLGQRRSHRAEESRLVYAAKVAGRWPATAATTLW